MAALLAAVVVPASPQGALHFLIFCFGGFELTLCQPDRKVRFLFFGFGLTLCQPACKVLCIF